MTDALPFKVQRVRVALEPANGTHVLTPAARVAGRLKAHVEGLLLDDQRAAVLGRPGRYVSRLPDLATLPDLAAELRGLERMLEAEMAALARRLGIPWSLRLVDQAAALALGELGPEDLLVAPPHSRLLAQIMAPGVTFTTLAASLRCSLLLLTTATGMKHPIVCGTLDASATRRAVAAAALIAGDEPAHIDLVAPGGGVASGSTEPGMALVRALRAATGQAALALAATTEVHDLIVLPMSPAELGDVEIAALVERLRLPVLLVP